MPLLIAPLLAGCMVGPDFVPPNAPPIEGYLPDGKRGVNLSSVGGPGQRVAFGAPLPPEWWTLFDSPALADLVRRGIERNADVKAQEAAIVAAQHMALAQRGALFPQVAANGNFTREKVPTESRTTDSPVGANIFSVHTAQLTASFVPDVFGGTRRAIESAEAQAAAESFRREAILLTMASNIALAAIQEASLRGQIAATNRLIRLQTQVLDLLRNQESVGQIALPDVLAQETALAQARLLLPPLEKQLAQQRNLLATLTGEFPATGGRPSFELSSFKLPRTLPVSLPADLVRQRPDIKVAEAAVHSANAQVGVAIANRLPQFKISGDVGSAASTFSKLFAPGTGLWMIAADAVQPIFDGFALRNKQYAAEAQLQQAVEQYRGVVLVAFANVADALLALEADAKALAAATAAEQAAARSIEVIRRQLEQGQISLPTLLTAQQAYLQTSLARVQAQAARLADTVALFQALGGGWWKEEVVVVASKKPPETE